MKAAHEQQKSHADRVCLRNSCRSGSQARAELRNSLDTWLPRADPISASSGNCRGNAFLYANVRALLPRHRSHVQPTIGTCQARIYARARRQLAKGRPRHLLRRAHRLYFDSGVERLGAVYGAQPTAIHRYGCGVDIHVWLLRIKTIQKTAFGALCSFALPLTYNALLIAKRPLRDHQHSTDVANPVLEESARGFPIIAQAGKEMSCVVGL